MKVPPQNSPTPENSQAWWDRFGQLLDDQEKWPTVYTFKFIAPADLVDEVKARLEAETISLRPSSKGTYVSVTAIRTMPSSQAVIDVYERVGALEGVIPL